MRPAAGLLRAVEPIGPSASAVLTRGRVERVITFSCVRPYFLLSSNSGRADPRFPLALIDEEGAPLVRDSVDACQKA